jgi:hypothetical protein
MAAQANVGVQGNSGRDDESPNRSFVTQLRHRRWSRVQRAGRRMQVSRGPVFRLLPAGHGIHFHRFKFGKIEPEMLCNERA